MECFCHSSAASIQTPGLRSTALAAVSVQIFTVNWGEESPSNHLLVKIRKGKKKGKEKRTLGAKNIHKSETNLFFWLKQWNTARFILTFLKPSALILRARLQTQTLLTKWREKGYSAALLYAHILPAKIFPLPNSALALSQASHHPADCSNFGLQNTLGWLVFFSWICFTVYKYSLESKVITTDSLTKQQNKNQL